MIFEHPGALALFALAVPVIILHLVRRRPRPLAVSSLAFWDDVLREQRTASIATRMLRYLPLTINLLILTLVTLAAASPVPDEVRRLVIVLDNSASMGAKEAEATRLELAKREAERLISGVGRHRPAALATCEGGIVGMTDDVERLRGALRLVAVDNTRTSPEEIVAGIRARVDGATDVVVISDHNTTAAAGERIRRIRVGSTGENVGIVDLALMEEPARGIRIRVRGSPERDVDLTIGATLNGKEVFSVPWRVARGVESEHRFDFERLAEAWDEGGVVRVALSGFSDALAIDNDGYLVVPRRRPPRVVVVTARAPGKFLTDLLSLLGGEGAIDRAGSGVVKAERYEEIAARLTPRDVRIFDGCAPKGVEGGARYLVFAPEPGAIPVKVGGMIEDVRDLVWNRHAGVNRLVSPDPVRIKRARRVESADGGEWLMASAGGGVVAIGGSFERARCVYVGFDLEESDFGMRPSFPVFVRNAIGWLREENVHLRRQWRLGETMVPASPLSLSEGSITYAGTAWHESGEKEMGAFVQQNGLFRYRPERTGIYSFASIGAREVCAANFLNPAESDIAPKAAPRAAPDASVGDAPADIRWDRLAAIGALVLLLIEWICYHRGIW